ncbi:hypothetical protein E2C01_033449 [Portunus trituberculatus]|uniref:Uncharacterized protein n=1 Tax=Portunus trituberculatus TaxID=210409 RepID=A0A5B7F2Y6_PORTR|nr:hypothetical protein [Portunus trituberculatus]
MHPFAVNGQPPTLLTDSEATHLRRQRAPGTSSYITRPPQRNFPDTELRFTNRRDDRQQHTQQVGTEKKLCEKAYWAYKQRRQEQTNYEKADGCKTVKDWVCYQSVTITH